MESSNEKLLKDLMLLNRESTDWLLKRYSILRCISYTQPIGRRQLAAQTGYSEREVRAETDSLRMTGLIRIDTSGMIVTITGQRLLEDLQGIMQLASNMTSLEDALKARYSIQNVSVVSGDADRHLLVKKDLGVCAALQLRKYMAVYKTIAITGHPLVKHMVEAQEPAGVGKGVTFYPARTAQMNKEDVDANNNCAAIGKKTGAQYRLLHLGSSPTLAELEKRFREPDVIEIVNCIENADLFVSGITGLNSSQLFNSMSVRARGVLMQQEPCCEILGSFIKADGKQINNTPLYSLGIDKMAGYKTFMMLSAGKEEAEGLHALVMRFKNIHLVTDEATANLLLKL